MKIDIDSETLNKLVNAVYSLYEDTSTSLFIVKASLFILIVSIFPYWLLDGMLAKIGASGVFLGTNGIVWGTVSLSGNLKDSRETVSDLLAALERKK